MKLNLGCGNKLKDGWVNVDLFSTHEDVSVVDLEVVPWPWETDSVDEVELIHILEHLGDTSKDFINILKELYRVCKDGAIISITVPHWATEGFVSDPTHKRAITPTTMMLFDQKKNQEHIDMGYPNTPLGLQYGIDFETITTKGVAFQDIDQHMLTKHHHYCNVIADWSFVLKVRK